MFSLATSKDEGQCLIKGFSRTSAPIDSLAELDHVPRGYVMRSFCYELRRRLSGGSFEINVKPNVIEKYIDHIVK